jgi:signal peptidase I
MKKGAATQAVVAPFLPAVAIISAPMPHAPRWLSALTAAALLVAVGTAWIIFAPLQFGGQASYVVVNGNSMEPLYHKGDLVIVQSAAAYQVGEIVTYRHPQIGSVIHRIIGRDGERYVMKGDHNTWTDSYKPGRGDVLGKAWIYLPSAGALLMQLRTPLAMALIAGLAGAVVLSTVFEAPKARRRGRRRRSEN